MRRAALWTAALAVALTAAACGKLGPPLRAPEVGAGQQAETLPETGNEIDQEESP